MRHRKELIYCQDTPASCSFWGIFQLSLSLDLIKAHDPPSYVVKGVISCFPRNSGSHDRIVSVLRLSADPVYGGEAVVDLEDRLYVLSGDGLNEYFPAE